MTDITEQVDQPQKSPKQIKKEQKQQKKLQKKREKQAKQYRLLFPANKKGKHVMHAMNFLRFLFYPLHRIVYPFKMYGAKKVPDGPFVYVGNHYNIFDIFYDGRRHPFHVETMPFRKTHSRLVDAESGGDQRDARRFGYPHADGRYESA